ncbi:MAG TPA: glycosyltransferase [Gemmatimonadaceae bacterium]
MTAALDAGPMQRLTGWRAAAASRGGLTDCSLVVPTYERPAALTTLLDALLQLADTPADVVIVDGSRGRATGEALDAWIAAHTPRFDLSYVRSPAGLTLQRNVGVDASRGAFVFFLDDDCVPDAGYFQAIRDVFARDENGNVGAVAGAIINNMGGRLSRRWRLRFALGLAQRADPGSYLHNGVSLPVTHVPRFTGTRRVQVVPGGAVAYRRAVLDRHRFSLYFSGYAQGEDLEMSLRVGREWTLLWCGDAHLSHNHAPEGRPNAARKGRMEVRNRYFIWKRHARPRAADSITFWLDFVYGMGVDGLEFAAHPTSMTPLQHARGVLGGWVSCLTDPPRYDEPPARREYDVDFAPADDRVPAPLGAAAGGGTGLDARLHTGSAR